MSPAQLCNAYARDLNVPLGQFNCAIQVFLHAQEDTDSKQAMENQENASRNYLRREGVLQRYKDLCKARKTTPRPRRSLDPERFNLLKKNRLSPPQELPTNEWPKIKSRYTCTIRDNHSLLKEPPRVQNPTPKTPQKSKGRDRGASFTSNASSWSIRREPGTVHKGRKKRKMTRLAEIKERGAPRMRPAGALRKKLKKKIGDQEMVVIEDLREKIKNVTAVINLTTQMVQHCIITLVNYCHEAEISLEPLIRGSGHGGQNFIQSMFTYFSHLLRGTTTIRNRFQFGSPQETLINLAKELYNPLDLNRVRHLHNLIDSNQISFEIDYYNELFADAAIQVDSQLARVVKGRISQLEDDILSADPSLELRIKEIQETFKDKESAFQRFLELCELAPKHLKPTLAPLSRPTHAFVHIPEKVLLCTLSKNRCLNLGVTRFTLGYVEENPGHLLNELFNFDTSGKTSPRVWRTFKRKMTKFVFAEDHVPGDRKFLV